MQIVCIYSERLEDVFELAAIDRLDRHTLQLGTFTRFDRDVALCYAECSGDEFDQFEVRGAFYRR
jgi:hypothetical protein